MPASKSRFAAPALLAALALPLAGCISMNDPLASTVTSPGQYGLYDCPAIKVAAGGINKRQRELEGLIARANRGAAGGLVSATTYQPEYVTLRGKMSQLRREAAAKHCGFDPATVRAEEPEPPLTKKRLSPRPKKRPGRPLESR